MNIRNDIRMGSNFHQYNRHGTFSEESSGGNIHKKHLSAERSASVTPIANPVHGSKRPPSEPIKPLQELQAANKDRESVEIVPQKTPAQIDEPTREMLEDRVRRKKRHHDPCPFSGSHGECFRPDIRCGERAQYSGRETDQQHGKPHRCLYTPFFPGDNVIIVENDLLLREFLLDSFKLFLNYDLEKVSVVSSTEEATSLLTTFKLQDRSIGLIILNCSTLGTNSCSHLLNEIFDRNIAAEIILTGETPENELLFPEEIKQKMIDTETPFISAYLQSPIHSDSLIKTIHTLFFGRYL